MNFRNISSWCIRNPVFPIVLFVAFMLAGLVSFARMQVNNAPDIDFPAAIVNVSQPGAAPNELETQALMVQRPRASALTRRVFALQSRACSPSRNAP